MAAAERADRQQHGHGHPGPPLAGPWPRLRTLRHAFEWKDSAESRPVTTTGVYVGVGGPGSLAVRDLRRVRAMHLLCSGCRVVCVPVQGLPRLAGLRGPLLPRVPRQRQVGHLNDARIITTLCCHVGKD